jgi:hypothetical protein
LGAQSNYCHAGAGRTSFLRRSYFPLACVEADFVAFQKDLQNIWGSEHRRLHAFLAEEDITFAARWGLK